MQSVEVGVAATARDLFSRCDVLAGYRCLDRFCGRSEFIQEFQRPSDQQRRPAELVCRPRLGIAFGEDLGEVEDSLGHGRLPPSMGGAEPFSAGPLWHKRFRQEQLANLAICKLPCASSSDCGPGHALGVKAVCRSQDL